VVCNHKGYKQLRARHPAYPIPRRFAIHFVPIREIPVALPHQNFLHFLPACPKLAIMTQPLALVFYEKLLPGSQLVNRLQDINYRVLTASTGDALVASATNEKPMIVFADLAARRVNVVETISKLRQNPATTHLPIVAFADEKDIALQSQARDAGATLVVNESAILTHLQHFLDQALQLD
jgi:CheY-like chemotaxis protein